MSDTELAIPILRGAEVTPERLRTRFGAKNEAAEHAVAEILADVYARGDDAVLEYTRRFDGVEISSLAVDPSEIESAASQVAAENPGLLDTMTRAAENIRRFHERQVRQGFSVHDERGGIVSGQRVIPLDRVGLYIPGGTAVYPSTLLMNAIPAKLAGVKELILASPPQKDGRCAPTILAAAKVAGVDRIFRMGGAQAVAALAYGTVSVPRVDKITGPGNVYVQTAKRQLYGLVDIEMIAGPSEILIIADESANARFAAADLLSQAEHDAMAAAILLTTSAPFAEAVRAELARQLVSLPRREIARRSIEENGRIAVIASLSEAAEISNAIAPEHLELCVKDPFALLGAILHAGSVFLGHYAPEALGDYFAGPNHTLPTNGAARFSSPLSVDDFVKKSSFLYYTKDALRADAEHVARFARAEQLEAHARSAEIRLADDR
ncbi:MAG: histidinol dehydrogenase [Clostridiales bacterium]|jgi:histidinol dehydrogenase|nr:histidinol dehydrogenase [Clostridiales bacterium]